jgi:hypothetical protein
MKLDFRTVVVPQTFVVFDFARSAGCTMDDRRSSIFCGFGSLQPLNPARVGSENHVRFAAS